MPTNIYDQHRASFPQVSAYVIAREGKRVATIAIKFPRDGAGRLYAYVHFIGAPMVRGFAGGYGYDKTSAAVTNAASKLTLSQSIWPDGTPHYSEGEVALHALFHDTLARDGGQDWDSRLRDAGFDVWQAV